MKLTCRAREHVAITVLFGRVERTLLMLDWLSDPEQRRRTNAVLNKGEARNALR